MRRTESASGLKNSMSTAIILAAGQGTRLRGVLTDLPKGFLKLGDKSIIEESIERLVASGVDNIVIVTGYRSEHYVALARAYAGIVRTIHNPKFADSGSMYSLYCARALAEPPFLLLESDLIYEPRALQVLLEHQSDEAILLSGPSYAGDEVYVETSSGYLRAMSKDPAELGGNIAGELVGISKISPALFTHMIEIAEAAFRESLLFDYETDCLVAAGGRLPIACPIVENLLWAEIDDPNHLGRARETVYPLISALGVD